MNTTEHNLRGWIAAVAAGDASALDSLFQVTAARIHGLVRSILGDPVIAEEVVLETYTRAWSKASLYSPERGTVSLWLLTIARRIAIDKLRAKRGERTTADAEGLDELPAPDPSPYQASLSAESADQLRGALDRLNPEQRRAIEATFFEGLTHAEAAAALGQPIGTLKSRVRAGLTAIRGRLVFEEDGAA